MMTTIFEIKQNTFEEEEITTTILEAVFLCLCVRVWLPAYLTAHVCVFACNLQGFYHHHY